MQGHARCRDGVFTYNGREGELAPEEIVLVHSLAEEI